MIMNNVKYVVSLMVIVCGMGVLTPWSTCDATDSTVSKLDGKGISIKMNEELAQENPHTEKS
jgi:hypothetical protein